MRASKPFVVLSCLIGLTVALFGWETLFGSVASGQTPEFPGPEKEHAFLKKFEGRWTTDAECVMGPDLPPVKTASTTNARMIGEFWIVNEVSGDAMGQPMTALQTIGYDAKTKKYVGTWIDSMIGYLWQYEGTVDEAGAILTLEAEGPNFMTGEGTTLFRDVYEFKSADHILATSFAKDTDGKWVQFVTAHSRREAPGNLPRQ